MRNIEIVGRTFTFTGRPGDPYFENGSPSDCRLFNMALHKIPTEATIFDVGANIGMTVAMAKLIRPDATVYCFEPDPQAYDFLIKNLASNNLTNCLPAQVALSDRTGKLSFFNNPTSASASHLVEDATAGIIVDVMTLDQVVEAHRVKQIDLIKIDVEGFEADVLRGAECSLRAFRPIVGSVSV